MKATRLLALLTVFVFAGCTGWAIDETEKGWDDFEDGAFSDARLHFEDATLYDPTYADAYNGIGWCNLFTDSILSSLTNFDIALSYDLSLVDAKAGGALAATEAGEHLTAVNYANDVISGNSSYEFSHYDPVDIWVIRLAKAKSAAAMGDFDTALEEIQVFDSTFDADPNTNQGQANILAKLEILTGTYGAWAGD